MKSEYHTKQRARLLQFFRDHRESAMTNAEICSAACVSLEIGKSTVYRLLPKLAEEGLLTRFYDENKRVVTYQFVDVEHGCDRHFHLKCADCGRTIHLENQEEQKALEEILRSNAFASDERHTVVLGKCRECRSE